MTTQTPTIPLAEGERYIGGIVSADGITTHIILLPGSTKAPWKKAMSWAAEIGGDLPNRVECVFDDAENDNLERPVRPVEDIDAQLAAGRVLGDFTRKINIKKYPLAGVTVEAQAIKMAWSLLDVGAFDEGGLANNLELRFRIWFLDALDLFPTKVIKVESDQITRYGFEYFRVKNIKRMGNLHVELTVQAYSPEWYAAFETLYGGIDPMPDDPTPPTGSAPAPPTDPLVFGDVTYAGGNISIEFEATP